ncbi:hypothetical protein BJ912DRAFT_925640 [Pholiota molesta]|nr:hypothetical protein BJ912DRAFT_925640 [Pholiota molesta]
MTNVVADRTPSTLQRREAWIASCPEGTLNVDQKPPLLRLCTAGTALRAAPLYAQTVQGGGRCIQRVQSSADGGSEAPPRPSHAEQDRPHSPDERDAAVQLQCERLGGALLGPASDSAATGDVHVISPDGVSWEHPPISPNTCGVIVARKVPSHYPGQTGWSRARAHNCSRRACGGADVTVAWRMETGIADGGGQAANRGGQAEAGLHWRRDKSRQRAVAANRGGDRPVRRDGDDTSFRSSHLLRTSRTPWSWA